ncbi:hypothetical protein BGZ94_007940 [Podila epigama]|nr:hypothetical protein BGZ94_007940 [Podila epigama]
MLSSKTASYLISATKAVARSPLNKQSTAHMFSHKASSPSTLSNPWITSTIRRPAMLAQLHRPFHHLTPISSRLYSQVRSAVQYGQPTWMTHPHLMKEGELTPGISTAEYELRRALLMESLPKNSIVISTSHRTRFMTNNIFYPFHQHTDFSYLCGFNEPDSALILEKNNSARGYKMTMFVAPKNAHVEMWEGARTGLDAAKEIFGADEAVDANLFRYRILDIASRYEHVYFDFPTPSMFMPMDIAKKLNSQPVVNSLMARVARSFDNLMGWARGRGHGTNSNINSKNKNNNNNSGIKYKSAKIAKSSFSFTGSSFPSSSYPDSDAMNSTKSLSPLVQELRVIKSESEIKLMRQAGEISGKAFIETMKFTNPERLEHQVYAKFDFECRMRGSQMMAYVPVVAGGPNALTMHYVNNDQGLNDGDLILMDAGGEYNGYASDITRTWPVNGKFTDAQKDLYEVVLRANKECIKLCTEEHGLSLNQIHFNSMRLTLEGLAKLGIKALPNDVDRRLYPHHVGHYLGMDVHDTGDISRSRTLKEGMVVTIEPGLYIPRDPAYPEKYQGIGIRIEDNVVIGKTAPVVLSVTAPKEIVDIDYCCNN